MMDEPGQFPHLQRQLDTPGGGNFFDEDSAGDDGGYSEREFVSLAIWNWNQVRPELRSVERNGSRVSLPGGFCTDCTYLVPM